MDAHHIKLFREKLKSDKENSTLRGQFHQQYEWLEAYWNERYKNNLLDRFSDEFGDFYWSIEEIKGLAHIFAMYPPVGSSNLRFEPSTTIKRATFHLRYFSNVLEESFPEVENDKEIGEEWKKSSFNALLTIIKQIRDNLFHGKKMELAEDQYQRNKELVGFGVEFTTLVLDRLEEVEGR